MLVNNLFMPNSPSRIASDEESAMHEKINFVDPGNFGAARVPELDLRVKAHLLFVLLAVLAIALIVALQMGWI